MDRQNVILGVIAVIVLVVVGAFVFWPESPEQAATATSEPAATTEGGGTGSTDATAPTTDESVTGEPESSGY